MLFSHCYHNRKLCNHLSIGRLLSNHTSEIAAEGSDIPTAHSLLSRVIIRCCAEKFVEKLKDFNCGYLEILKSNLNYFMPEFINDD